MKRLIIYCIFLILFISINAIAQDKLVFAIDLIRHGDRTPIIEIPKHPHQWQQGLGELTAEGMQQEYALGKQFRRRYIDNYHLLPPSYVSGTLYVRSTDFNRTLMSAESLLLGLYPLQTAQNSALPNDFQPIPIHTMPQAKDNVLAFANKKNIPAADGWQAKQKQLGSQLQHWSQVTGIKTSDIDQMVLLGDNLLIRQIHHVPLPPGINATDAAKIIATMRWAQVISFKPQQIGVYLSHALLITIGDYLQNSVRHPSELKYVLLSAHDSTIASVMSALQAPLDQSPPYASDLNFLLFESDRKQYYVKVSYNEQPVTIPACKSDHCSLSEFIKLTKST